MPDKFTYVKKGYDPEEVEDYIKKLEEVIKSYKDKDSAIKNAIINAQIAADNITKNAEMAASEAKSKTAEHLEFIRNSAEKQRQLLKSFQVDYNNMINHYLRALNESELLPIYSRITELEEFLLSLSGKLEDTSVVTPGDSAREQQEQ